MSRGYSVGWSRGDAATWVFRWDESRGCDGYSVGTSRRDATPVPQRGNFAETSGPRRRLDIPRRDWRRGGAAAATPRRTLQGCGGELEAPEGRSIEPRSPQPSRFCADLKWLRPAPHDLAQRVERRASSLQALRWRQSLARAAAAARALRPRAAAAVRARALRRRARCDALVAQPPRSRRRQHQQPRRQIQPHRAVRARAARPLRRRRTRRRSRTHRPQRRETRRPNRRPRLSPAAARVAPQRPRQPSPRPRARRAARARESPSPRTRTTPPRTTPTTA